MVQIPAKRYFRIGEVSQLTGLEPHVIRYWETEFPQLKPLRVGSSQRLYGRDHVELLATLKTLIQDEQYTLAGARRRLAQMTGAAEGGLAPGEALSAAEGGQAPVEGLPAAEGSPSPAAAPETSAQPSLPLFPLEEGPEAPAPPQDAPPANPSDCRPAALLAELRQELAAVIKLLS